MLKDISVFLILLILVGCSINVEDSTRIVSSSTIATGINGIKVTENVFSSGDLTFTGDSTIESINLSVEINQMVLQNEAPAAVNIYLQDIENGNRKVAFKTVDSDWQSITIGDISAQLPPLIALDLSSLSGDINVKGMKSSVFANASSGDVDIITTGVVDVDASSGDVTVKTESECRVDASSGDVAVYSPDKVTIDASSGDVEVSTVKGCNIEASSGDVKVTIINDSTSFTGVDLDVSSGDVIIVLPDGFAAWLDIKTSSGDIYIKNSDVGDKYSNDINNGEIGERVIKIRCSSGDVSVKGF